MKLFVTNKQLREIKQQAIDDWLLRILEERRNPKMLKFLRVYEAEDAIYRIVVQFRKIRDR